MNSSAAQFRMIVGYSLVGLVALYLALSLYMLVPGSRLISRKVTQYYNWFVLPGPFFRDDRIKTIPHLHIASKTPVGSWTDYRNVEMENFRAYYDHGSYASLKQSRYERFMARAAAKSVVKHGEAAVRHKSFLELQDYLKKHYLRSDVDSVRLLYLYESTRDDGKVDTVFEFSYKAF